VAACVGEDDRDVWVANPESGESVCEAVAVDVLELENGGAVAASTTIAASGSSASRRTWKARMLWRACWRVVEAHALDGGERSPSRVAWDTTALDAW
jgi:hypothetical protein